MARPPARAAAAVEAPSPSGSRRMTRSASRASSSDAVAGAEAGEDDAASGPRRFRGVSQVAGKFAASITVRAGCRRGAATGEASPLSRRPCVSLSLCAPQHAKVQRALGAFDSAEEAARAYDAAAVRCVWPARLACSSLAHAHASPRAGCWACPLPRASSTSRAKQSSTQRPPPPPSQRPHNLRCPRCRRRRSPCHPPTPWPRTQRQTKKKRRTWTRCSLRQQPPCAPT